MCVYTHTSISMHIHMIWIELRVRCSMHLPISLLGVKNFVCQKNQTSSTSKQRKRTCWYVMSSFKCMRMQNQSYLAFVLHICFWFVSLLSAHRGTVLNPFVSSTVIPKPKAPSPISPYKTHLFPHLLLPCLLPFLLWHALLCFF